MSRYWRKLGCVFDPGNGQRHPKLNSHAANPLPVRLDEHTYRVFYSGRDQDNRSSVGAFDFDLDRQVVTKSFYDPFFEHGSPESYYSHGVSLANCYDVNGQTYMLFMGWSRPPNEHWFGQIGRLELQNKIALLDRDEKPLLGLSEVDPVSLSYPWVLRDQQLGYWMWYGSTVKWESKNQEMVHVFNFASSLDGEQWTRHGLRVPYKHDVAQAFSRPTVIRNGQGNLEMWFSYRGKPGKTYRIGHAVCDDKGRWQLDLESLGLDVGPDAWDSEMVEYPFVLEHNNRLYMFYNGNGFGRTGIGLAVLENESLTGTLV